MSRSYVIVGALFAALGVALGAFGAHALRAHVDAPRLAVFETGVRYQLYHALAILVTAWAQERWGGPLVRGSGWLFGAGIVLFSGSLYALVLTGMGAFGAITPFGGVCFLAGWLCLAMGVARAPGDNSR